MFSPAHTAAQIETRMLMLPPRLCTRLRALAIPSPRPRLASALSAVSPASSPRCFSYNRKAASPRARFVVSLPSSLTSARNLSTMSSHPFTGAVVEQMQSLYPEALADRAWDNVGLLLENSWPPTDEPGRERVLLTNDLTPDVVEEAIGYKVTVIVSYHPIIFRGLKALTLKDTQQASLLRLMQKNIAVYCPHTALDAGAFGINDWLAEAVSTASRDLGCSATSTTNIKDVKGPLPASYTPFDAEGNEMIVGYGRRILLHKAVPAAELIKKVVRGLGLSMSHVLVARPRGVAETVSGVGVCAGSGFDILRDLGGAQMLITGEVSHHDAIYATTRNVWVVCLLHSNSERQFLSARLQGQLTRAITERTAYKDATVIVSERDRDPFEIWDVDNPPARRTEDRPEAYAV